MKSLFLSSLLGFLCLLASNDLFAQTRGGGGARGGAGGAFGQGAAGGGTATRNATAQGAGMATGAMGGGAMGGAMGGGANGQTLGTTNLNAADGSLGAQQLQQGGFVGTRNNGGFVGTRDAGQTGAQSAQPQFGNLQQGGNRQGQARQQQQGRTNVQPVRPQYRIEFSDVVIPQQQVTSNLTNTALNLPTLSNGSKSVEFIMDDLGRVTLSGTVESERDRKLIESYVRMEPGVRSVTNTLSIAESVSTP